MSYPVHYVPAGDVLPIFFDSFAGGTGASVTMSGLAVTDIEIYKDGGTTQRASDAGYTLLDTDGIDFDGLTGIHGFSIDTGDNTDAGFYTVGAWFHVVVSAITVDSQTVSFVAAAFRLMPAESSAGAPKVDVSHAAGTAWASGAITAASIANGAIDAATFAADVDAEILSYIVDDATRIDASALNTATGTTIPAILVDTGTTLDGKIDTIDTNVDAILVDTSTTLQGELDGIQADTEDIQSRLPAALTAGGNIKADALAVDGSTAAAARMERAAETMTLGTADAGCTTTSIVAKTLSPASAVNDQWNGKIMHFDLNTATTALRGQSTDITDYVHATLTFTVTALTTAPSEDDTFVIS